MTRRDLKYRTRFIMIDCYLVQTGFIRWSLQESRLWSQDREKGCDSYFSIFVSGNPCAELSR